MATRSKTLTCWFAWVLAALVLLVGLPARTHSMTML